MSKLPLDVLVDIQLTKLTELMVHWGPRLIIAVHKQEDKQTVIDYILACEEKRSRNNFVRSECEEMLHTLYWDIRTSIELNQMRQAGRDNELHVEKLQGSLRISRIKIATILGALAFLCYLAFRSSK